MRIRFCSFFIAALLTLAICGSSAFAQSQDDLEHYAALSSQYLRNRVAGRIDEAATAAEQAYDFLQRRFPKRDQFKGSLLLAEARSYQGRYRESAEMWQQVMERLKDYVPQNETERQLAVVCYGDSLRSIGLCLDRMGRAADAIAYHEAAARFWAGANHPDARLHSARAKISVGDMHRVLGDNDKASRMLAEATAVLEPLSRAERSFGQASHDLSLALHIWGEIDRMQDRYDLAEPKLRRALQLRVAENGWQHLDTALVLDSFVRLYGSQGRWHDAEQYARAGLAAYEHSVGKDHVETTNAVLSLAQVVSAQNRRAEAETLLRRAVTRMEVEFGTENPRTTAVIKALARTLWLQDKFEEAEPLLKRSLAADEKTYGLVHRNLADNICLLANLKFSQGDAQESLRLLDRLADIHTQYPLSTQDLEGMHITRSSALWVSGQREAAVAELERALVQVELLRGYSSGAERERAEMFENLSTTYATAIQWQAELKNVGGLFLAIERAKARSFLDELRLKNVDLLAGLPEAERRELVAREAQLRKQLTVAEQQLEALPDPGPKPSPATIAQRKPLIEAVLDARDQLYRHLADVRSASPIYRGLIMNKAEPTSLPQIQKLLSDDELLLTYSVGKFHSYVISIRKDSADFAPLDLDEKTAAALGVTASPLTADVLSKTLQDKATGLLTMISSPKRRQEDPSGQLAALWTLLIPKAERAALTSGKLKRLTIIPDGPLALLPFETLVVTNEDTPEYLLDVGPPIAYAPSASVLLNLVERKQTDVAAEQKLLTLGDPTYPQAGATGPDTVDRKLGLVRAADRVRAGLTPLPYTGKESIWVQQTFEKVGFTSVKLRGAEATEAGIRRHAAGRQIIHLACHGMADQSYGNFFGALFITPGRSGDPRDDGSLTMSEIYELDLSGCELAILSACETNYGPQQQGEGTWALSRGFLVAGSKRVVASNWVVDDQAGATLVSYFSSYLSKAGQDPAARDYAAALHNAKLLVRKEEKWRHPFYWSSLVLVGPK